MPVVVPADAAAPPLWARLGIDVTSQAFGLFCGCLLAVSASLSFAWSRAGILAGLSALDLTVIRFSVAALLLFPVLLRAGVLSLGGIGWPRGLVLLLTGGPLFILPQAAGAMYAPLAHGGVIAPATVTVFSTIMAAIFLRERLSLAHIIGAFLVIAGIVLISWHGLMAEPGSKTWIGDLLFIGSSMLWGTFTVLVRAWRLHALRAVAVIALLSALVTVPFYLIVVGWQHFVHLPAGQIAIQALVQGVLQGAIGIVAYSHAIRVLGVSRAVLFPASVPAMAILIGIPTLGEIPTVLQIVGVALVTVGLVYAVGAFRRRPIVSLSRS